jgi:DNA (cytosine-5)-methyltransferase 1
MAKMIHGSLFSGIGGFDLAAEWAGWRNAFHCEWNEFGQKILKHYWPNAKSYGDITKTDFSIWRNRIDVLTGGFPCQPYSHAGKRKGKEDERHLWPEMLRAIREIAPSYVVGENVYGLVNWNGGMVFHEVQTDLENEGYEVQPVLLPACSVNAPHKRERVWFVAYSGGNGCKRDKEFEKGFEYNERRKAFGEFDAYVSFGNVADTNSNIRCKRRMHETGAEKTERYISSCHTRNHNRSTWYNFPTQSPICSGNDGISSKLDGITFPKWRNESIKAYGNAIVPQVVYQIFKAINLHHSICQRNAPTN